MSELSLADRKKQFIEDCCGGMGGGAPTMSGGDAMYTSASPAEGPTAGFDPMLGKKKRKSAVEMSKRLRKEGYNKGAIDVKSAGWNERQENRAAAIDDDHRKAVKKATGIDRHKYTATGDHIRQQATDMRNDPTEYAKEKQSQMIANRARGFRKGKYKKMGEN